MLKKILLVADVNNSINNKIKKFYIYLDKNYQNDYLNIIFEESFEDYKNSLGDDFDEDKVVEFYTISKSRYLKNVDLINDKVIFCGWEGPDELMYYDEKHYSSFGVDICCSKEYAYITCDLNALADQEVFNAFLNAYPGTMSLWHHGLRPLPPVEIKKNKPFIVGLASLLLLHNVDNTVADWHNAEIQKVQYEYALKVFIDSFVDDFVAG